MSSHYDRTENFTFSWKIGDFEQAAKEAENLAKKGPSRDRMLYRLEEGATKRIQGNLQGSAEAFDKASLHYEKWLGVHLRARKSVSEELISTIGSAEWKPYKSRVYERVMLRMYQALNFLSLGKDGLARAEIFKTRQAVVDAKEIWKVELDASREAMRRKSIDLEDGSSKSMGTEMDQELAKIKLMIPDNLPEYVNPAAIYLEALYFLHGGTQRDDFEKASFSLREVLAIHPSNPWIQNDFEQANQGKLTNAKQTYVFLETGRAPVRREKRIDLPLVFFSATSRLPYLGLAFPTLYVNDQYLTGLEVGKDSVRTRPLADLDAIVAREFEKDFPIELTKAISGALAKGGLQYLATNAVRSEGETIQAVTGIGVGALAQSMTRADWRSWTTLPKRIQFCKIPTPASGELTLRGVDTNISLTVPLMSAKTNILWVRSVSAHTPLRLTNHFAF